MTWSSVRPSRAQIVAGLVAAGLTVSGVGGVSPAAAQQVENAPPIEIMYGFTLIDGTGSPPLPEAALVIQGRTIVDAGTRAEVLDRWENEDRIVMVDLGGGYLIPGLIDAHVHLATSPNRTRAERALRRLLYAGVTSVRDMAGDGRALASLARDAQLGDIDAPDIYYSALMAGPSFFDDPRPRASAAGEVPGEVPWMQAITPETEMVTVVAMAKGTFATGIKIYANLELAEVERITEEAHRQGMVVWAHTMVFPARPLEVVRADVDVVSHACPLAWAAMAQAPTEYTRDQLPEYAAFSVDAAVFTELFQEMSDRGTILDATLAMYGRFDRMREEDPENGPPLSCETDFARQLVRKAIASGVLVAAGTDFELPEDADFPALHFELEELVDHGGHTPLEAILAATRVGSLAIGIGDTHGTLEPGKMVNMVLLDADPTADIRNLRAVREVWKNAARYSRENYAPPEGSDRR